MRLEELDLRYYYDLGGYERFREAQRTYIRSSARRRFIFHASMWGMLLIGVVLISVSAGLGAFHGSIDFAFVVGAGLVTGGLVTPLLRPWQLRRMHLIFNSNKDGRPYIEVNGPILVSGIEGRSESRFQRPSVCNVVEGEDMILLFTGKKRFIYFSKQSLPSGAIDEMRAWLSLPGAPSSC